MPSPVITSAAVVLCTHAGSATPSAPSPRVSVLGSPVISQMAPWLIAGCTFPPPPVANGPCVSASWTTAAARVTVSGQPVLVQSGMSICAPTGTPLIVSVVQPRVSAQ